MQLGFFQKGRLNTRRCSFSGKNGSPLRQKNASPRSAKPANRERVLSLGERADRPPVFCFFQTTK